VDPRLALNGWVTARSRRSAFSRGSLMTVTAAAETYLLITRLTSRDLDTCQDWLATTWAHLARVADRNS
jgi:hypothetical protein